VVARLARRSFETEPAVAIDGDTLRQELDIERCRERSAVGAPLARVTVQAVVDVQRPQPRAEVEALERGKQHARVETAARCHGDSRRFRSGCPSVEHTPQRSEEGLTRRGWSLLVVAGHGAALALRRRRSSAFLEDPVAGEAFAALQKQRLDRHVL
jgi:hypothetical protein